MIRSLLGISIGLLALAPAGAQTAIGPFTGTHSEGFESTPLTTDCADVFNGGGNVCQQLLGGIGVVFFVSNPCHMTPLSGSKLLVGGHEGLRFTFDGTATEFGGYFASGWVIQNLRARFYDEQGALIGELLYPPPADCVSWSWFGASAPAGRPFRTIELVSIASFPEFNLRLDDLQANISGSASYPAPTTYCTAKVTSGNCTPTIGTNYTGTAPQIPKVGYVLGFQVFATQLEPNKNGLFFYGVNGPLAAPFSCTGFLCVKPPITRTPVHNSGGSGACTGALSFSWNPYVTSGPVESDPGYPYPAGTHVWMQCWFRDPLACEFSGLSDAVEFVMQ